METIRNWNDLEKFGIVPLTGEACRLSMRLLVDLTARGKRIVEAMFSAMDLKVTFTLPPEWNGSSGTPEERASNSMLLPVELFRPLAVFCLLDAGCADIYVAEGKPVVGLKALDYEDAIKDHGENGFAVLDANIRYLFGTVPYPDAEGGTMELLNARHVRGRVFDRSKMLETSLLVGTRNTHAMSERTV